LLCGSSVLDFSLSCVKQLVGNKFFDGEVECQREKATYVLFTVHTDDNTDDDDTLIFYSIEIISLGFYSKVIYYSTHPPSLVVMPKGKRGFKFTIQELESLLNAVDESPCLCRYCCHLPHFVDCCLPPQFLLLSATAIAFVATAATTETASAAAAIAIHPRHRCN
jgi:hypothetical protein